MENKNEFKNELMVCIMGGNISSTEAHENTQMGITDTTKYLEKDIKSIKKFNSLHFVPIAMKDSRMLNENDLNFLLHTIKENDSCYILITHGTYTMEKTANFIRKNLQVLKKNINKIIYFVGSENFLDAPDSDALKNLETALSEIDHISPGVYMMKKLGERIMIQ